MNDDNRWIVSSHDFKEHRSPILAENERRRLAELFPQLTFKVYRIKRVTNPSSSQIEPDHGATDGE